MAKPKMTRWISGTVSPSLPGVYQRDYRNAGGDRDAGITYSHWNGKRWAVYGPSAENAKKFSDLSSSYQNLPWRGLAEQPKESR